MGAQKAFYRHFFTFKSFVRRVGFQMNRFVLQSPSWVLRWFRATKWLDSARNYKDKALAGSALCMPKSERTWYQKQRTQNSITVLKGEKNALKQAGIARKDRDRDKK